MILDKYLIPFEEQLTTDINYLLENYKVVNVISTRVDGFIKQKVKGKVCKIAHKLISFESEYDNEARSNFIREKCRIINRVNEFKDLIFESKIIIQKQIQLLEKSNYRSKDQVISFLNKFIT